MIEMMSENLKEIIKEQRKNNRKKNFKRKLLKPYKIVESIILCLRFPFLYPRNRWTGNHYTNWKLYEYHKNNWNDAYVFNPETNNWDIKNKLLAIKIKIADNLNKFLGIFHCIPSYTELDAMPHGWRKVFGIQMCKEIKKALLEDGRKALYNYRIEQIKEKFGSLRWYDYGGNRETENIIYKYEYISSFTCINCGRGAKYRTNGWIENYCDKCIPENQKETASKYFSDIPFYGYTNMEYHEKNKNKNDE